VTPASSLAITPSATGHRTKSPPAIIGPRRSKASVVRRVQGAVAMTFVALLAATIAIPAVAAPSVDGTLATSTSGQDTQTLLAGGAAAAVQRDGYSVTEAPPPPPPPVVLFSTSESASSNSYARTADTFTNNPLSPIQWPFTTGVPISDGFGARSAPCGGCSSYHKGLDMNPGQGTPIQVIADGVVTTAVGSDGGGLGVYAEIEHVIDGQAVTSVYGHMLEGSLQLTEGQVVTVGQQVGNVGNTGTSTGAHLHFEIHLDGAPVDPYPWMISHVVL
jgi:murein DD-endopeptidase MepM/ murein hydrolase activator NlpD